MQHEYSGDTPARPDQPTPQQEPPRLRVRVKMPDTPPTFTYLLLGLIVLVYLAGQVIPVQPGMVVKGYRVTSGEELLVIYGAKINELILNEGEWYRLLTAIFLHGGLAHLFFNGYALYVIGQDIERLYGHARFLIIYLLGGLTASVSSLVFSPAWSVGASGALFAIFGAEMVFLYRHRRLFGEGGRRRLQNLVWLLILNLAIGLLGSTLIDNWAHIGGFVGGTALAWLIGPQFRPLPPTDASLVIQIEDDNPLQKRIFVPFAWAAGLILVVGVLMMSAA